MSNSPSIGPARTYEEQNLQELRFARTQSYFERNPVIRCLIGVIFFFFLFLFLHFRETYVEVLELGDLAKRYVVAQVDFAFPDDEATVILKQEAAREIGTIYRIKSEEIEEKTREFQKFITQIQEGGKEWDYEKLALALSLWSDALSQARFTDFRTFERIEELPQDELAIKSRWYFVYLPPHEGKPAKLPVQFWHTFAKYIFDQKNISPEIIRLLLAYFERDAWIFEVDQGTEYTLRKLIQAKIPEKYTRVTAGERIIDQGERITSRHIAMLQAMKEKLNQKRNLFDPFTIVGSLLMSLLLFGVGFIYLKENHPDIYYSNRKLALLNTVLLLSLVFAKATEIFLLKNVSNIVESVPFPLFVPFAAMILSSLMNFRIASVASIFLAVVFAMGLAVEPISFLTINLIVAMVAILSTRSIRKRKEIFIIAGKAWIGSVLVILAFDLSESSGLSISVLNDITGTFLFMLVTAVLVVGLLPILESLFKMMTDITLMEFMDPGNELLRRLSIEAPGTYQHSMVVGNLSEAAASGIGANGLFCRVATLYHDVGKLANPQYFTENQLGGVDMHQLLTPLESTQVIIDHVREGVALARKVGLPEQFIDIIKEHHGTTLVNYFYHKQIELMGGDKSKVNESDFRYSGPKPRTKESTIIMIADTLEAASRTLDTYSEETITALVHSLIAQKAEDGQFDESLLTFEELGRIRRTLIKTLLAASHPRIKYPAHHPGEEG